LGGRCEGVARGVPCRSARQTLRVVVNGVAAATVVVKDSRRLRQDWSDGHVGVAWQHVRSEAGEQEGEMLFRRQECCGWREECGRFWHRGGRRAMMRRTA
jgi:hypothetical protein